MRLHRFYVGKVHDKWGDLQLDHHVWINDERLSRQWYKVLRYKLGDKLILFNDETERIYRITKLEPPLSFGLELVTELKRQFPPKHIYLLWSLLKKDKNDWVLQKSTELGVKNFVPVIADRSEKTGFNLERAHKIVVEAAEQCGRADIPDVREPISLAEAIAEYADLPLFVCDQQEKSIDLNTLEKLGVLIGPEGGWSENEKDLFIKNNIGHINIASFTLRAETAAITIISQIMK